MREFEIFAEESLLLEILSEQKDLRNWNSILAHHALINLDMEEEQLDLLKSDPSSSLIGEFMHAHGHKKIIAAKKFFQDFENENSIVLDNPFSAYFIDKDDQIVEDLSEAYGLIFQNFNINDNALTGTYGKTLEENEVYDSGQNKGWKLMLQNKKYIFNTLIFTDPHIFLNEENSINIGIPNVIHFFDSILPENLRVPMQILIITSETNQEQKKRNSAGFTNEKAARIFQTLERGIKNLRKYEIIVEMIFTPDTVHDRYAFTNYNVFECRSGFKLFSVLDNATVKKSNKFELNYIFNKNVPDQGDTNFHDMIKQLLQARSKFTATITTLKSVGCNLEYRKCFGLESNYSVNNRIIQALP